MKYSPEFLESNARLKTLDEETLNDALNNMNTDELLAHGDYILQQKLEKEDRLSDEEAQVQIDKLLELTREPVENDVTPIKTHTHRTIKRIALLAAAILVLISVFMVVSIASKRDFSIINGVVTFKDGKVHVHFLNADDSDSMSMQELEADLEEHGFKEVKLPGYFNEGNWTVENVAYEIDDFLKISTMNIINENESYLVSFDLYLKPDFSKNTTLFGAEGGETINVGEIPVYLFDHGNGRYELVYFTNNIKHNISSVSTVGKMREIAKTVF